jgi:predicted enzyme related to lactoylglutathione lyase
MGIGSVCAAKECLFLIRGFATGQGGGYRSRIVINGKPLHLRAMSAKSAGFQGLRTAIYHAPDIGKAKSWYSEVLGIEPYFDEPFYVGFNVGGFELGLDPDKSSTPGGNAGVVVYWGVEKLEVALENLVNHGATRRGEVQEVGGGIKLATVFDPFGNILGVIENPGFSNAA